MSWIRPGLSTRANKRFTEYKSGGVGSASAAQVRKDMLLLERGEFHYGAWVTVARERIAPEVADLLREAQRRFPGRFEHIVVSREERDRAIERGGPVRAQLELHDVAALRRQQQVRARARAERLRQAAQRAREERRKAAAREATDRAVREIARDERAKLDRAIERADAAEAARARAEREQQEQQRARREREAAEERIRRQREANDRVAARLPREVGDLLDRSFPAPGEATLPPGTALRTGATQAGRAARARDERGQQRERR